MAVRIYNTTGTYPSLNKTGSAIYTFDKAPDKISFSHTKTIEMDEIPLEFMPEAWDSYYQTRKITISGYLNPDESIKTQMENFEKLEAYYTIATSYPTGGQFDYSNSDGEKIYALGIDIPDNGTTTEKLLFVIIESSNFDLEGPNMTYNISFREIRDVFII